MKLLFDLINGEFLGCVTGDYWDEDCYMIFNSFEEAYYFFRCHQTWDDHWKTKGKEVLK